MAVDLKSCCCLQCIVATRYTHTRNLGYEHIKSSMSSTNEIFHYKWVLDISTSWTLILLTNGIFHYKVETISNMIQRVVLEISSNCSIWQIIFANLFWLYNDQLHYIEKSKRSVPTQNWTYPKSAEKATSFAIKSAVNDYLCQSRSGFSPRWKDLIVPFTGTSSRHHHLFS